MSKLYKKFKVFMKITKEREWLEDMALKGYMLENIKLGMLYYFRKDTHYSFINILTLPLTNKYLELVRAANTILSII